MCGRMTQEERYGWIKCAGAYIGGEQLTLKQLCEQHKGPYGEDVVDLTLALQPADSEVTVAFLGQGPATGYYVADTQVRADVFHGVGSTIRDAIENLGRAIGYALHNGLLKEAD